MIYDKMVLVNDLSFLGNKNVIWTYKIRRQRRQRELQKAIGLISETTILHVHHAFFYFFDITARLRRETS